jgi:hypothetical protein
MDNQHKLISGYRDLSQAEIDLMNEIKAQGVAIEALCAKVESHVLAECTKVFASDFENHASFNAAEPEKWARWGRDGMQVNLMYLTRAVARPSTF